MKAQTLEQMKEELAKCKAFLSISDGRSKWAKQVKARAKYLDMQIFRTEQPESFENHKQALQAHVNDLQNCFINF